MCGAYAYGTGGGGGQFNKYEINGKYCDIFK